MQKNLFKTGQRINYLLKFVIVYNHFYTKITAFYLYNSTYFFVIICFFLSL